MSDVVADGSVRLDPEAQKVWQERFGERFVYGQWQPQTPSRAVRRRAQRAQRRRGDGRPKDTQ